jgi:hypothetical protein
MPYILKSTTPIQESSSSSQKNPSLGVYNLPPNLGKGDILTFPEGMEGNLEETKFKVRTDGLGGGHAQNFRLKTLITHHLIPTNARNALRAG